MALHKHVPTAALGLFLCVAPAIAGPLATTNFALDDGFGPDSGRWHGSVDIAGAAFGDTVTAKVDWAAFLHDDFQLYLDSLGIAQPNPSVQGEVVYAYQIVVVDQALPGIDTLTVGIDAADGRGTVSAPSFIATGQANARSPISGGDNTTSMVWFFNGNELQVGEVSDLLIFTSPFAPEFDFLQLNSGLAGPVVSPLVASPSARPAPTPEPATLAMIALGALALGRRKPACV